MMKWKFLFAAFFLFTVLYSKAQNVVIVIIDGARYSETFGDPGKTHIPRMYELSQNGSYCDEFYNNHFTYTSQAIPALWSGSWEGTRDTVYMGNSTQYSINPSIFEYFRKQKNAPQNECYYILKYVSSLWLQSFHDDYGPDYWPATISQGSTDDDVLANTIYIIENEQPQILWVYLADVDHAGHSGDWDYYISSIENADDIVNTIWETLQSDNHYKDNTTMFVTNDHGRHDDQHGGFTGHGCSCDGCRHIMFLALGPDIKEDYISEQNYEIADVAVTASEILAVDPEFSSGQVMSDIFKNVGISDNGTEFNLKIINNQICFNLEKESTVKLEIYNMQGKKVETLINNLRLNGKCKHVYNQTLARGIYFIKLHSNDKLETIVFINTAY